MSNKIVDVWKLLWPNGISKANYERAVKMVGFVEKLRQPKSVKIKEFKPRLVPDEGYMTTEQVSKSLGVTKDVVYIAVKKGHLSATHKGKSPKSGLLISKGSFEQYKKDRVA